MKRTTLKQQSEWISRRKAELGLTGNNYVAVNAGERRTDSKKVLLEKIKEGALRTGKSWSSATVRKK